MLTRRNLVLAGGAALLPARPGGAATRDTRTAAIDRMPLPATFSGLVAHARNGRLRHVRCQGLADAEARRPVTERTAFRWGSASKWIATAAVLRLADLGRVSIDAPVGDFFPRLDRDAGARVRVRHLLSNTSGIPDRLSQQVKIEPTLRQTSASAAAIVDRFAGGELAFAPGRGWDYAALNWAMVAAIVERVTGQPFPDAVRRLVLSPLGINGAGFDQPGQPPLADLAAAYRQGPPLRRNMSAVPPALAASGTLAGTVRDAVRAAHGIFHGRLLRPTTVRQLVEVAWPAENYALGGRVQSFDGGSWAWEAGKVGGYRTLIAHRLAHSETIVVFNNTDMEQSDIGAWVEGLIRA